MNEKPNIQHSVGENIKKFRLARGLTLDDLADKIYKSKSTISKYEKGTISIDIATLEEIAIALDVHPAQLLMEAVQHNQIAPSKALQDESYMFSYDGKEKRIIQSVIEKYRTDDSNRFSIRLFYDIPSRNHLRDCVSVYQGSCTRHEVLENYTLENTYHQIEQIWLSCVSGLSQNSTQVGFLAGLLNSNLMPAVRKVILSPHLLNEDELMEHLVFTKKDLQTIRKLNLFTIDEYIA